MKTINDLNKTQAALYRSYVKANQLDVNQQARINDYMELGKKGHREIIEIVELMKDNNESTAKIKTQVSRASKKLKITLSLQGLGKDSNVVIGPKQDKQGGSKDKQEVAKKAPKPEDSVEPNTKSFDFDELDRVFLMMATDEQNTMIKHLTKLMKETTKLRLAS